MARDPRLSDLVEAVLSGRVSRREMLRRASVLGLGGATLAALPTGALRGTTRAAAASGGQVIVGTSQEAINYNPLLYANNGPETAPEVLMFDSLQLLQPDGSLAPNLATEVPTPQNGGVSADGLVWTFKLRQGVKWHDGQPFTAKDVLFTWQTIMNPKVAVRSRVGHDKVAKFETPDDYTVKITLKGPYAPYQLVWTQGTTAVIPEHILSQVKDINTAPFNTSSPVGTGPFKFVEHVGGDHLSVERNPAYHGGPPKLDRIILKVIPELTGLYTQFKTGEVDVVDYQGILPDRWDEAQHLDGRKTVKSPSSYVEFIYFNNGKPWFQDKRVKQALYHGIDVKTIIDTVYYGLQPQTLTYLAPTHWAYNPEVTQYPFDLAKGNALLDQAGWVKGKDGIRAKDGVRLAFTNSTTAGNTSREQAQQITKQSWKQLGVDMTIKNMPAAVVWGEYTIMSHFDTLMVAWNDAISSDPDCTSRLGSQFIPAQTGSGANYVQFKNPDADKLMAQGASELDRTKRVQIYHQLQALLAEELPWAPIFNNTNLFGYNSRLTGYTANPYCDTNLWNAANWSVSQ